MRRSHWVATVLLAMTTVWLIGNVLISPITEPHATPFVDKNRTLMQGKITIKLGQRGDDIVKLSGLSVKRSQVSTALLYDASPDRTGVVSEVVLIHGNQEIKIPELSVQKQLENTTNCTYLRKIFKTAMKTIQHLLPLEEKK